MLRGWSRASVVVRFLVYRDDLDIKRTIASLGRLSPPNPNPLLDISRNNEMETDKALKDFNHGNSSCLDWDWDCFSEEDELYGTIPERLEDWNMI